MSNEKFLEALRYSDNNTELLSMSADTYKKVIRKTVFIPELAASYTAEYGDNGWDIKMFYVPGATITFEDDGTISVEYTSK